ncbi:hypothetical protein HL667_01660 [Bradyrhizobium sp. 83012]|uniref:Uncharacterized protein n=1 Tax=Bradyrhizobium aeschynomenes TaxID=2734909 RepID=A0ABX2C8K4_9BRAD|nr:hypothetical protein [Bradyrhizobium aeschynomenes]NPU13091.1 hypothetical protein [Bradyrhizobium aeschynomenes]NPU63697.1 hypothetical protein [Bradyrhizobium aeschynomenes]NPV19305.1 hypothetical protein [Bradyrhizobium aeschynomenes]
MSKWIVCSGHEPQRADRSDLRPRDAGRQEAGRWKPPIPMTGAALLIALATPPSLARDRGQYANSSPEMKAWFDGLRSGKGPCCSDADGSAVSDVDWESKGGHYRVRIEGEWLDVPDDAVITEPNRVGRTMVWPMRGYQGLSIRCFMPGSMT